MNQQTVRQTVKGMLPAIGQTVLVECSGLSVACIITDVKTAWGRNRFQVKPTAGSGEVWIEESRIIRVVQGTVTVDANGGTECDLEQERRTRGSNYGADTEEEPQRRNPPVRNGVLDTIALQKELDSIRGGRY